MVVFAVATVRLLTHNTGHPRGVLRPAANTIVCVPTEWDACTRPVGHSAVLLDFLPCGGPKIDTTSTTPWTPSEK